MFHHTNSHIKSLQTVIDIGCRNSVWQILWVTVFDNCDSQRPCSIDILYMANEERPVTFDSGLISVSTLEPHVAATQFGERQHTHSACLMLWTVHPRPEHELLELDIKKPLACGCYKLRKCLTETENASC